MITLSDSLSDIICENPFLEDSLYSWYLNLTWFAHYIKPNLDKKLQKQVSISSIKMALSRFNNSWFSQRKFTILKPKDFFIKKNMNIFYLDKTKENLNKIHTYQENLINDKEKYFSIINWNKEIWVITNWFEIVIDSKLIFKDLALIWIYIPENFIYEKWMFYYITKQLLFHWINVVEIISTYTEISVIVNKDDLKKSFNALCIW